MRLALQIGALALATTFTTAARAEPADPTLGLFAQEAAISNEFEVAEAKIILETSTNPTLRNFATEMVRDHGMAQAKLSHVGTMVGVPTAFVLDKGHQASVDELGLMEGQKLDSTYLDDQILSHANAAANLEGYITTGSDPALRAYARQTLPVVKMHQRMLEQISGHVAPL